MAAGGEALELALGLLRSPAHRRVLQRRSLPEGMTELLEVASGSVAAQQSAAARMRASPGHLQEAARFFVQQVLFTDDDAYRVLGADASATDALLRSHHRLLLRWLHPDRNPGALEWETTFAHRVNQAWNQLRTPDLRRRYDGSGRAAAARPPGRTVGVRLPAGVGPVATGAGHSRLAPLAVLLLGVLCLLLAWLAVRGDRRTEDWDRLPPAGRPPVASSPAVSPAAAMDGVPDAHDGRVPLPIPEQATTHGPPVIPAPSARPASSRTMATRAGVAADPTIAAAPEVGAGSAVIANHAIAAAPAAAQPQIDDIAARPLDAASVDVPVFAAGMAVDRHDEPVVLAGPALDDPDPLQLLREADATVVHLARYLASPAVAPPNWSTPSVERHAMALRTALEARVAVIDQAELSIDTPNWLFGGDVATLNTAYQLEHAGGTLETGLMHVRLERGLDGWQVATVQLEPAR